MKINQIRKAFKELEKAEKHGLRVLQICKLCDLVGAIRAYALQFDLKLADLHDMAKKTREEGKGA